MERPVQIRNMQMLDCTIFYQSMPSSGKSDSPMFATQTLTAILWVLVTAEFLNNGR